MDRVAISSSDPRLTIQPIRPPSGGTLTLALTGELDVHSVASLCDIAVTSVESGVRRLRLDMTGVTVCDNGSLYMLLGLQHALRATGGALAIATTSTPVESTLTANGLSHLLEH
ncbi:STAS domain-containing protein [Streptomyces sp. NPDC055509]